MTSIITYATNAFNSAVRVFFRDIRMKPFANDVASMIGVDNSNKPEYKGVIINVDKMSVINDMDIKKIIF